MPLTFNAAVLKREMTKMHVVWKTIAQAVLLLEDHRGATLSTETLLKLMEKNEDLRHLATQFRETGTAHPSPTDVPKLGVILSGMSTLDSNITHQEEQSSSSKSSKTRKTPKKSKKAASAIVQPASPVSHHESEPQSAPQSAPESPNPRGAVPTASSPKTAKTRNTSHLHPAVAAVVERVKAQRAKQAQRLQAENSAERERVMSEHRSGM